MCAFGEQILRWFHEENRGLTGGQSRFDEAEPAEKMPPNVHLLGVNQYYISMIFFGQNRKASAATRWYAVPL